MQAEGRINTNHIKRLLLVKGPRIRKNSPRSMQMNTLEVTCLRVSRIHISNLTKTSIIALLL